MPRARASPPSRLICIHWGAITSCTRNLLIFLPLRRVSSTCAPRTTHAMSLSRTPFVFESQVFICAPHLPVTAAYALTPRYTVSQSIPLRSGVNPPRSYGSMCADHLGKLTWINSAPSSRGDCVLLGDLAFFPLAKTRGRHETSARLCRAWRANCDRARAEVRSRGKHKIRGEKRAGITCLT